MAPVKARMLEVLDSDVEQTEPEGSVMRWHSPPDHRGLIFVDNFHE